MKKTIDEWLFWAYRDQLPLLAPDWQDDGPEGMGDGWGKVGAWRVGGTNRYGIVHALEQGAACHPLAIALADRVLSLDAVQIGLPDGWNPCEDFDMDALGPEGMGIAARAAAMATHIDRFGQRRMKRAVSDLVRSYALTGRAPEWECEPPRREVVRTDNGQPRWFRKVTVLFDDVLLGRVERQVEQDGYDRAKKRPFRGAYQKHVIVPDPLDGLVARAEYEVLHAALDVLADEWPDITASCGGEGLCDETTLVPRPWMGGLLRHRRILPCHQAFANLSRANMERLALAEAREQAERVLRRERERQRRARRKEEKEASACL